MRRSSNLRLALGLASACMVLLLGMTGIGTAKEKPRAGDLLTGCGMVQAFSNLEDAWREGRVTERELVLEKAKAFYGEPASFDGICSEEVLGYLKRKLLEDVYRLTDAFRPSDKAYLKALDPEVAQALDRGTNGLQETETTAPEGPGSVSDRIAEGLNEGRIDLKQAVLLRAKLRYAPGLIAAGSEFAPVSGEGIGEECGTGFYKDLHRVKDLLTREERALLRSFSPDLDAIVRSWQSGTILGALPDYSELDKKATGKTCIVHYTLKGTHAVPDATYAAWVASFIDQAAKAETKPGHFRAAYAEGGGKLHVYCLNMGSAKGEWVDVSDVAGTGKRKSGYIKMSSTLKKDFGGSWKTYLAGATAHEYFHGVQSAYNYISDLWFMEATTVWASCYYAGDYEHLGIFYKSAQSIFNEPNKNIWLKTFRMYSTSALAFFLAGKYEGHKIVKTYFEKSEAKDDAVALLKDTLAAQSGTPSFGDMFKEFLVRLYAKKISSIRSYMPNVKLEATHKDYGVPLTDGSVALLGANYYKLATPTDTALREAPLIAMIEKGATGKPQGVLVKKGQTAPAPVQDGRSYLPKATEAVYIVTDVDYASKDPDPRPYQYTAITPHVKIIRVTADSPIQAGSTSNIRLQYDLLGTGTGVTFPCTLQVVEKGPDVTDNASGDFDLAVGTSQLLYLYFYSSTQAQGTYRFTFQLKVPLDSWKIPQEKSNGSCAVVVEQPAFPSLRLETGGDGGGRIAIGH